MDGVDFQRGHLAVVPFSGVIRRVVSGNDRAALRLGVFHRTSRDRTDLLHGFTGTYNPCEPYEPSANPHLSSLGPLARAPVAIKRTPTAFPHPLWLAAAAHWPQRVREHESGAGNQGPWWPEPVAAGSGAAWSGASREIRPRLLFARADASAPLDAGSAQLTWATARAVSVDRHIAGACGRGGGRMAGVRMRRVTSRARPTMAVSTGAPRAASIQA